MRPRAVPQAATQILSCQAALVCPMRWPPTGSGIGAGHQDLGNKLLVTFEDVTLFLHPHWSYLSRCYCSHTPPRYLGKAVGENPLGESWKPRAQAWEGEASAPVSLALPKSCAGDRGRV